MSFTHEPGIRMPVQRERERDGGGGGGGGNEEGCIIIPTQFTAIRDHSSPSLTIMLQFVWFPDPSCYLSTCAKITQKDQTMLQLMLRPPTD